MQYGNTPTRGTAPDRIRWGTSPPHLAGGGVPRFPDKASAGNNTLHEVLLFSDRAERRQGPKLPEKVREIDVR